MTTIVTSIPNDLLVQRQDPDHWHVMRFSDKMEAVKLAHYASEGEATDDAVRLATQESVNVFKPSGDGHTLALAFNGRRIRTEWLPGPGAVRVKIDPR